MITSLVVSLLPFFVCITCFVSLDPTTRKLLDEAGREKYYRGFNVIYKSPPWFPNVTLFDPRLSFVEKDMQFLNEWGMNVIRLGMMWPGAEPQRGTFDPLYMREIQSIVDRSATYNISTLLDMHQDSISQLYCGEGAPEWAVTVNPLLFNSFPLPLGLPFSRDPVTKWPSPADCAKHQWADYQWSFAGADAYGKLYDSEENGGMREELAKFWGYVAKWFNKSSSVIGYELINEPFAGNIYKNPLLLVPWEADKISLQPVYDAVVPSIYQNDLNHLVFFEPVTWSGQPYVYEGDVGFEHPPGGQQYASRSVFSFHYYNPPNLGDEKTYFEKRQNCAKTLSVGSFVTEFDINSDLNSLAETLDIMESLQLSWIAWEYKSFAGSLPTGTCTGCGPGNSYFSFPSSQPFGNHCQPSNPSSFLFMCLNCFLKGPWLANGSVDLERVAIFSRTYAQAVAGNLLKSFFSRDGTFSMTYVLKRHIMLPTEIYVNQDIHYPNGFSSHVFFENLLILFLQWCGYMRWC
eukprot:TRINITY_DN516_c0_g1_i1.p1 TRINITY_DN516_c0_g1~~TRINITY_DN516_c0_g1_i1.p1  ORF type:complete len:518 (+),score=73.38 TRINITY_DN516_c0_g1_i1:63-1616(+)